MTTGANKLLWLYEVREVVRGFYFFLEVGG